MPGSGGMAKTDRVPTRLTTVPAVLAVCLVAAAPAIASNQPDPVAVGPSGGKATRGFSSSLGVFVTAPSEWVRGCCYTSTSGQWDGPRYRPSKNPNIENRARLVWQVTFARGHKSLAKRAQGGNTTGWPVISSEKLKIPHIVGGRRVGKLPAYGVLDGEAHPGSRRQGIVAINLSRHVTALASFIIVDPIAEDWGTPGTVSIDGMPAGEWATSQVKAAWAGVFVEGNLPPKRVAAKTAKNKVKGKVTDAFGDPLSEAKLLLQRKSSRHWKTVRTGTTGARGTYKLRIRGAGLYRVVTQVGGTTARSKHVRAR